MSEKTRMLSALYDLTFEKAYPHIPIPAISREWKAAKMLELFEPVKINFFVVLRICYTVFLVLTWIAFSIRVAAWILGIGW